MTGAELVTALQVGDSAYPSGAFGYSWGMETLLADGHLRAGGIADFAEAELHGRWHGIDRPALAGGWRARDIGALVRWDGQVDLSLWSEAQRLRSAEAGAAMLTAALRLKLPGAAAARAAIADGRMVGHLPCLTGALHRGAGLALTTSLLVSANGFLRGILSAAVRLGRIGALTAQEVAARLVPDIARLAQPPAPGTPPCGFAVLTDIAMMRPHAARLFVN